MESDNQPLHSGSFLEASLQDRRALLVFFYTMLFPVLDIPITKGQIELLVEIALNNNTCDWKLKKKLSKDRNTSISMIYMQLSALERSGILIKTRAESNKREKVYNIDATIALPAHTEEIRFNWILRTKEFSNQLSNKFSNQKQVS